MDYYAQKLSNFYHTITYEKDERIRSWPLIESPVPGALLIVAYLSFLWIGPKWMAHRPPMKIQWAVTFYNFFMVAYSLFVAREFAIGFYQTDFSLSCNWTTDYSNSPGAVRMAGAVWYFFIAKFIELLDTVFFILRKKTSQVTFLHVFHHGCLPMFWWWGVKAVPGGFGTVHAHVNCLVHVVMYLYYGLASLGPKYRKYLWWKRYVTVFQLAQFFIVTLHNSQYLFLDCAFPWKYVAFIQGFTTIVAILFLNFYVQTYKRKPHTSSGKHTAANGAHMDATLANGAHMNGYLTANGHAQTENGHSENSIYNLRERKKQR